MRGLCALTAAFLSCLRAQCIAQELPKGPTKKEWRDIITTDLSGSDCKPADTAKDSGARICKGVAGYSLLLKGDELRPEVYLIAPNQRRYSVPYWNTSDPKYQGLLDSVTWTVDWNLSEIGMAQADMGLIDEARTTASMIGDPSFRNSVEYSIKQRAPGPE